MAVLDSSAIIALLLAEPGADIVNEHLPNAVMSAVNIAEVIGFFARRGVAGSETVRMLAPLRVGVFPADEALSWEAGDLVRLTAQAGLSLGDRYCLALARRLQEPAVTADRQWRNLTPELGVSVLLIR